MLLDKSLLVRSGKRLHMYESIRAYAAERLEDMAADDHAVAETPSRHAAFFAKLGTPTYLAALHGPLMIQRVSQLTEELENLQTGLDVAVEEHNAPVAAALAAAVLALTDLKGPYRYGIELADRVLAMGGLSDTDTQRLESGAGILMRQATLFDDATRRLSRAMTLAQGLGDTEAEARALLELGNIHGFRAQNDAALSRYDQALALVREVGARWLQGLILGTKGTLLAEAEERESAQACFERSLAIAREVGDRRQESWQLSNLAVVRWQLGDISQAKEAFETALDLSIKINDVRSEAINRYNLADLALEQGDHDRSVALYAEALAMLRKIGARTEQALLLQDRCRLWLDMGEADRARLDLRSAVTIYDDIGMAHRNVELRLRLAELALDHGQADAAVGLVAAIREGAGQDQEVLERLEALERRLDTKA
jgi:tetratricopeptide (TPR) repeat protein